tara:strand:- start:1285 stop:1734 length:450 start_codon:yes stop_codon:yes gene_type:complete
MNYCQHDTRCPLCRKNVPDVHEKTKDSNIDYNISLDQMYNTFVQNKRRYARKRRRILNMNEKLKTKYINSKECLKDMISSEKELDKLWDTKLKKLWKEDEELNCLKKLCDKRRKKYNRLNKYVKDKITSHIGSPPDLIPNFEAWVITSF